MSERIGQQLGNYTLTQQLGEGGFAEVYLGEHIHLGTQAAIKILHTQLSSESVDEFRNEARTIARLVHPNIVRVLEFGIEGITPFLVMDFASNGTLRQRHPKGTILPLTSVVTYVKQVADALQYAHDEKLIHRDVKPENMLLGRRNEVLLSDFGIALVAQSSRYQSTKEMAGTMAYMAPEQIAGKPRPSSDQYALGIVVYEWLSGERPFHGSFTEIVAQHLAIPPTPLREKVANVSLAVQEVVMTALAKDPKQRFGSIQAFARALEQASYPADAPTFVKSIESGVQPPRVETPTKSVVNTPPFPPTERVVPIVKSTVTPPLPPTEIVVPSQQPVGTVIYTLRGHTDRVNALAWSPDGRYIASGSSDRTARVLDVTSRHILTSYSHRQAVSTLTWSPDGQFIASGSDDKTVQVWRATNGSPILTYKGHSAKVNTVAWSPDGSCIASASDDKTIQLWQDSGTRLYTYRDHILAVSTVAWSPDSSYVVSASYDCSVQVLHAHTRQRAVAYNNHSGWVRAVACSPQGHMVASGGYEATIQLWDIINGHCSYTYHGHYNSVYTLAWSPNGKYIVSGDAKGKICVWNATNGNDVYTYNGHSGSVNAVAWSPDGKLIASAGDDKTVQVWVAPS